MSPRPKRPRSDSSRCSRGLLLPSLIASSNSSSVIPHPSSKIPTFASDGSVSTNTWMVLERAAIQLSMRSARAVLSEYPIVAHTLNERRWFGCNFDNAHSVHPRSDGIENHCGRPIFRSAEQPRELTKLEFIESCPVGGSEACAGQEAVANRSDFSFVSGTRGLLYGYQFPVHLGTSTNAGQNSTAGSPDPLYQILDAI